MEWQCSYFVQQRQETDRDVDKDRYRGLFFYRARRVDAHGRERAKGMTDRKIICEKERLRKKGGRKDASDV